MVRTRSSYFVETSKMPPPPPSDPAPLEAYGFGLMSKSVVRRRGKAAAEPQDDVTAATSAGVKKSAVSNPWFCLCAFHVAPDWLRENKYILDGYRAPVKSKRYALLSIFRVHNETVNIWTHLVGFVWFLCVTISFVVTTGQVKAPALPVSFQTLLHKIDRQALREVLESKLVGGGLLNSTGVTALHEQLYRFEVGVGEAAHDMVEATTQGMSNLMLPLKDRFLEVSALAELLMHDSEATHQIMVYVREHLAPSEGDLAARWPFYVFLAGAMVCLAFSSVAHTFHCITPEFSAFIWKFDYAGIVSLISSSFFPVVFYCFQCLPYWRVFYLVSIVILAVACIAVSCLEAFQDIKYQPFRACMFSGLGLIGIVPITHQFFFTWRELPVPVFYAIMYELLMAMCYLTGVTLFVVRVPERWYPGRFDIWLQSHNIFHALVVLGAVIHYHASMVLLQWRDHTSCAVDGHFLHNFYLE